MCGILGYSLTKNSTDENFFEDPKSLERILIEGNKLIKHRGPDDSGHFFDHFAGVGFGHRRLSIIDTSSLGKQPMRDSDNKIEVIYNGEIYNFKSLRKDLKRKGVNFKSNSDTEVIVYLYLKYGNKMLPMLNGIFSIAIWDKEQQEIFIARDNLGVKPLYYYQDDNIFAFSSEIKALLGFSNGNLKLDLESLARYISFLWCPGNGTPITKIKKLKPGHYMIVKKGKISKYVKWFNIDYSKKKYSNKDKCIEDLDKVLRTSIHNQMISDVEVGAFLSGGLDSSSVVAFAKEINPSMQCFTINASYEKGMEDDLPYAKQVAKHLNLPLTEVNVTPDMMINGIENMVIQMDEPLADIAPLNVKFISEIAKNQNIKVLLSGAGGDDIFTGYRRHIALKFDNFLSHLPRSIMHSLDSFSSKLDQSSPTLRRISKFLNGSGLAGDERIINYFLWTNKSDLMNLFSEDARKILALCDPSMPMREHLNEQQTNDNFDKMLSLEQRFFLSDHNLLYTDKMSMAEGVEVRVPLLDNDLLEFSRKIPNKWKQKGLSGKWIFKKVMEKYLPKKIIYRPKSGFGLPLRNWIRNELKVFTRDILSEDTIKKRGVFDHNAVRTMIEQNERGEVDSSYTILSLICIEIWCQKFLEKE